MQDSNKKTERSNSTVILLGTTETICAGSRDPPSSGLVTTADPPNEWLRVEASDEGWRSSEDEHAPRGGTYNV